MTKILLLMIGLFIFHSTATAQTYRIAEMNTEQIRRLNRDKTVALLPGGIIEMNGR